MVYRYASQATSSQGSVVPFTKFPLNQWIHYCVTTDLTVTNVYINGLLVNTFNKYSPIGANTAILSFGGTSTNNFFNQSTTSYYKGAMDDIGIWNRPLNSSEVISLYNEKKCFQTVSVTDTLRISTLAGFNTLPQDFGSIKVFPNPTNDVLNISIDKPSANYTIKIMDNTSKAVYTSTINSSNLQVNLNQFSSKGLYLIQILDNTNKVLDVRKLILE